MNHKQASQTKLTKTDKRNLVSVFRKSPSKTSALIHPFLQQQQIIGNRAVSRMIQAKLQVNQPGDIYEQEADHVADQVMRLPESTSVASTPRKPWAAQIMRFIQRQIMQARDEDEEESLQMKEASGGTPVLSPSLENQINGLHGNGQPLSPSVRAFFEPRFGHDFSGVRVHTDSHAVESARAVKARAYTVGRNVAFGKGQYAPETSAGKTLLAHELTHVLQQTGGAGGGTLQREEEKAAAPLETKTEKAESKTGTEKHYSLEAGVTLPANVEKKVGEIAEKYYAKNKKNLVVTSGTRTATSQAEAMFTKLKGGDNLAVYKDQKSAQAIKKAYDDAVAAKKSKDEIIAAMTTTIEGQIINGVYISNHLRAGAVDIRNKDMSADDKEKFKEAAKEAGITPLEEDTPPHFHLQID